MAISAEQRQLEFLRQELREGRISRRQFKQMRAQANLRPSQVGATKAPSTSAQVIGKQIDVQKQQAQEEQQKSIDVEAAREEARQALIPASMEDKKVLRRADLAEDIATRQALSPLGVTVPKNQKLRVEIKKPSAQEIAQAQADTRRQQLKEEGMRGLAGILSRASGRAEVREKGLLLAETEEFERRERLLAQRTDIGQRERDVREFTLGVEKGAKLFVARKPAAFIAAPAIGGAIGFGTTALAATGTVAKASILGLSVAGAGLGAKAITTRVQKAPTLIAKGAVIGETSAFAIPAAAGAVSGSFAAQRLIYKPQITKVESLTKRTTTEGKVTDISKSKVVAKYGKKTIELKADTQATFVKVGNKKYFVDGSGKISRVTSTGGLKETKLTLKGIAAKNPDKTFEVFVVQKLGSGRFRQISSFIKSKEIVSEPAQIIQTIGRTRAGGKDLVTSGRTEEILRVQVKTESGGIAGIDQTLITKSGVIPRSTFEKTFSTSFNLPKQPPIKPNIPTSSETLAAGGGSTTSTLLQKSLGLTQLPTTTTFTSTALQSQLSATVTGIRTVSALKTGAAVFGAAPSFAPATTQRARTTFKQDISLKGISTPTFQRSPKRSTFPSTRTALSIQSQPLIKTRALPSISSRFAQQPSVEVKATPIIDAKPSIKPISRAKPITTQQPKTIARTITKQQPIFAAPPSPIGSFTAAPPIIPFLPTRPSFSLKRTKTKGLGSIGKRKRTPSLVAVAQKIKAPKRKRKKFTGLEIRGI